MMATRKPGRSWKMLRVYFRRFRIGVWLIVLALLCALLYVNQIGLPDFVKNPLLEKLRERGLQLQFTRLRLRFPHGIVADNVLFGSATNAFSPTLAVKEIQVRLDYAALAKRQIQVNSLLLQQGRLVWPIAEANRPPRNLTIENIQTELRLLPGDLFRLDQFKAKFAGANIQLTGIVTNASTIRDWKIFQSGPGALAPTGETLEKDLWQLADALDQIRFSVAPELKMDLYGDALDAPGFGMSVAAHAVGAETPWGDFDNVDFSARVRPPETNEPSHCEIILRADNARTPWASAASLDLTLHVLSNAATNFNVDLDCSAARIGTEWGNGAGAHFSAQWRHSVTNVIPLSGRGRLRMETMETPWGIGRGLDLTASLSTLTNAEGRAEPALSWWTNLAPYGLELEGRLTSFAALQLRATNVVCAVDWQMPSLRFKQISAGVYDGNLAAQASLDVMTREINFNIASDCNVQKIPFLQPYITELKVDRPPRLKLAGQFVIPSWTNQSANSLREMPADMKLSGQVSLTNLSFHGVPFSSLDFNFSRTNVAWRIPDLRLVRVEGILESSVDYDERTRDYFANVHSTLDINVARRFIPEKQQSDFDSAKFSQPPEIVAEIRGRGTELTGLDVKGRLAVTNFSFREQAAAGFQSAFQFTNSVLTLVEPRLQREGGEYAAADSVSVDFRGTKVFLRNVRGHADPLAFASAIGPIAAHWFEPYHFVDIPSGHIDGSVSFDIDDGVDLHFEVDAGAFEWWPFKVQRIAGKVNWVNDVLTLKEVRADFYQGKVEGEALFHFLKGPGTDLNFNVDVYNANLHLLLNDLNPHPNQLAGLLSGHWTVTEGDATNAPTWKGGGRVSLRGGKIMEIPVFGVLSPALENIAPGLGSNRLSDGTASFEMTNGVIHSDDLDIRASGMRLQYRGDVDLDGRVNARAEAELLRDTWVVGRVLSLALWPVSKVFEYKIYGTLNEPKMEPLYFLPRLILMPLHPIETMKELMPKVPDTANTNAPPTDAKP